MVMTIFDIVITLLVCSLVLFRSLVSNVQIFRLIFILNKEYGLKDFFYNILRFSFIIIILMKMDLYSVNIYNELC